MGGTAPSRAEVPPEGTGGLDRTIQPWSSTSPPGVISQARGAARSPHARPRTQASPAGGTCGYQVPSPAFGAGGTQLNWNHQINQSAQVGLARSGGHAQAASSRESRLRGGGVRMVRRARGAGAHCAKGRVARQKCAAFACTGDHASRFAAVRGARKQQRAQPGALRVLWRAGSRVAGCSGPWTLAKRPDARARMRSTVTRSTQRSCPCLLCVLWVSCVTQKGFFHALRTYLRSLCTRVISPCGTRVLQCVHTCTAVRTRALQ